MAGKEDYQTEVIGTCATNAKAGSEFTREIDPKFLWSYAQEEALIALSEKGKDGCYRLITDPERRAKRIAARYADLYLQSGRRTGNQIQLYWVGLAAFVVKDIVEAFRYSREEVLDAGWRNWLRTSTMPSLVSEAITEASPYEHALRVYTALAKGNLWLFMDIYPWLWFFLEYGFDRDGNVLSQRLTSHVEMRKTSTLQEQSRLAVEALPFGIKWLEALKKHLSSDPVRERAGQYFDGQVAWGGREAAYGQHEAQVAMAHRHVRQHVKNHDGGKRVPPSKYWATFKEAFYVLEEEHKELMRVANDGAANSKLQRVAQFGVTGEMRDAYQVLIKQASTSDKFQKQKEELVILAKQEQLRVLQPLIYEDAALIKTMDINHMISRAVPGLSPRYEVVYSAKPKTADQELRSTFDRPTGFWDQVTGPTQSLPNPEHRMKYVGQIAKDYNRLMSKKRAYMEGEIRKISWWLNA
ncbi:MAG: hypothetical protein C0487_08895 [Leptothrix sp. (in: Bacteria)]|nr:hypothetical protein [Leptothrix sp. (in: b-proteobacteria)]